MHESIVVPKNPSVASLNPGDLNDYVKYVIHADWGNLALLYEFLIAYKFRRKVLLERINCTYMVQHKELTIYGTTNRMNYGEYYGLELCRTILDTDRLVSHPLEILLDRLRRVYLRVRDNAQVSSTTIFEPTGHEVAQGCSNTIVIQGWSSVRLR